MAAITAMPVFAQGQPVPPPAASQAAPKGPHPKLELVDPTYDFGTVLNGPPVSHVFKLTNAGQGKLIIGEVLPSCGCTAAKPSRTELGPGESSEIAVTLATSALSGHSAHTVMIATNDPNHPMTTLTMVGDVRLQVTATPSDVDFGKVARGQTPMREVTLTALKQPGFEIEKISNSNPNLKIERAASATANGGVMLKISLAGSMPVGPFVDTVDVATNRVPVKIGVYGSVTGPIRVDPPQVSFGIVPHMGSAERIVTITNSSQRPLKLLGMASSNSSVGASVEPVTPGKEYKVTVLLRKNTPDGQLHGQLEIKTDDPDQQNLTIPYFGIVGKLTG
ncbi:MAG TPA: DUF1573 domain-containing protein [Candidatus Binataceae bacterium]|nr:DUF1573 domain-containing protein [Candidatus Binataceae bacterium]